MKDRVVHRHVGFSFFNNGLLFVRIAFASGFERKWNEHAADLFVIADVRFHFFLGAVLDPLGQNPDFQKMIGIEINETHVAILAHDFNFVG